METKENTIRKAVSFVMDRAVLDASMTEDMLLAAMRLVAERVEALPAPAILDDMFAGAGVGLIWIPPPDGHRLVALRSWSDGERNQIDAIAQIVGSAIAYEMRHTSCPIIQFGFDNGASIVLYRHGTLEEAKKLCGLAVLQ